MTGSTKLMTPSGGGVTLTPANTATDKTLTVPADNGTLVYANSSGNVGIGTNNPAAKLEVSGSSCIRWATTDASWINAYATNPARNAYIGLATDADSHVWKTGGSERMRIDSNGNLLVGTTAVLNFASGSSSGFTASPTGQIVASLNNDTNYLRRTGTDGNLCVFYKANSAVGSISVTASATAYNTSSDYRLKENVQPMQNALGVVQQLKPVTYTWKADGSDGQGFIAHELQAVVPDCVTGEKDAVDEEGKPVYQGIDTSFLVATLTKAIQELSAKNDALEARIATLEAK